MPIYTYKCNACGKVVDEIRKMSDTTPVMCNHKDENGSGIAFVSTEMKQVLATPSAPQWNCSTSHSRSKGF